MTAQVAVADRRLLIAGGSAALVVVEGAVCWRFGWSAALAPYLVLAAVGVAAAVIDMATRRMPSRLLYPAYPAVAGLLAMASAADGQWWPVARALCAMAVVGGCSLVLALGFPGQLGLADVRLGGLLALGLGWLGWSAVLMGVLFGWLGAAGFVVLRVVVRGGGRERTLPLGPFLVMSALAVVLVAR